MTGKLTIIVMAVMVTLSLVFISGCENEAQTASAIGLLAWYLLAAAKMRHRLPQLLGPWQVRG